MHPSEFRALQTSVFSRGIQHEINLADSSTGTSHVSPGVFINQRRGKMRQDIAEIVAVQNVAYEAETQLIELSELQLALIGGGVGEVVFT
jgi:hypothetical protein